MKPPPTRQPCSRAARLQHLPAARRRAAAPRARIAAVVEVRRRHALRQEDRLSGLCSRRPARQVLEAGEVALDVAERDARLDRDDLRRGRDRPAAAPTLEDRPRDRCPAAVRPRARSPGAAPSRVAQNASATAAGAWRTSRAPWRQRAMSARVRRRARRPRRAGGQRRRVRSRRRAAGRRPGPRAARATAPRPTPASRRGARSTSSACTLPEPSQMRHQRRLAVGPGQARLLDVAEAALAFERLGGVARGALADPVLEHGRGDAPEAARRRRRRRRPPRWPGQPQRAGRRRLGLEREVGEHAGHRRLVGQPRPKAMRCAAQWIASAVPSRITAAEPSTQSCRVPPIIAMIARTPRPSSPTSAPTRAVELDLGGRVGAVAELVLQPVDAQPVGRAVVGEPGDEEAATGRRASGRARRRRRTAPRRRTTSCPVSAYCAAAERLGHRCCWAHVRAARPLGEGHADERARPSPPRAAARGS